VKRDAQWSRLQTPSTLVRMGVPRKEQSKELFFGDHVQVFL
jgi:hypothetical protein